MHALTLHTGSSLASFGNEPDMAAALSQSNDFGSAFTNNFLIALLLEGKLFLRD